MILIEPPPNVWNAVAQGLITAAVIGAAYGAALYTPAERMARRKRRTRQQEVDAMIAEAIRDIQERFSEEYDPADCILVEDGKWVR